MVCMYLPCRTQPCEFQQGVRLMVVARLWSVEKTIMAVVVVMVLVVLPL